MFTRLFIISTLYAQDEWKYYFGSAHAVTSYMYKINNFQKTCTHILLSLTSWQFDYVHDFMLMSLLLLSDFYKCKILSSSKFIYSNTSISKYHPVILVLLIKNTMVEGAHKIWMFYEFTKQYITYQKDALISIRSFL